MLDADRARSHVVTGGGRGVGRAVVERLLRDSAHVAVIELDPAALDWVAGHPRPESIRNGPGTTAR